MKNTDTKTQAQREGRRFCISHYKIYLEKLKKVKTNTINNQTNQRTGHTLHRHCEKNPKTLLAVNSFKSVHLLKSFLVVIDGISSCYKMLQESCVSQTAERQRDVFTVTQESLGVEESVVAVGRAHRDVTLEVGRN